MIYNYLPEQLLLTLLQTRTLQTEQAMNQRVVDDSIHPLCSQSPIVNHSLVNMPKLIVKTSRVVFLLKSAQTFKSHSRRSLNESRGGD